MYKISDEVNFDEVITFNHTYLKFRLFDGFLQKIEEIPFLMNNEFILSGNLYIIILGNLSFDEKSFDHNNKDLLKQVKTKVNTFLFDGDITFKSVFIENLGFYAKEIGFENTIDILLPLVTKLVNIINNLKFNIIIQQ